MSRRVNDEEPLIVKKTSIKTEETKKISWTILETVIVILNIMGSAIFTVPHFIFLCDSTNVHPRNLFIVYAIIYGLEWLYLTAVFIQLYRMDLKLVHDYFAHTDLGAYRRFCTFYLNTTLTFLVVFLSWILWLDNHEGPISSSTTVNYLRGVSSTGETPKFPQKTADGYLVMRALSTLIIYMLFKNFAYGYVTFNDLHGHGEYIDVTDKGKVNKMPILYADSAKQENSLNVTEAVYWGYSFCNIALYILSFVYHFIFFVHSFDVKIGLRLTGMFVLFVFIFFVFLVRFGYYYFMGPEIIKTIDFTDSKGTTRREIKPETQSMKWAYLEMKTDGIGRAIHSLLVVEQLHWQFFIIWEIIIYSYYFANKDDINLGNHIPQFDNSIIQQTNAWYVFQTQSVLRGAMLVDWAINLVLIICTSKQVLNRTRNKEPSSSEQKKLVARISKNAISAEYISYAWMAVSWATVLLVLGFNCSALAGYSWLARKFHEYGIAVFTLGVLMCLIGIMMSRVMSMLVSLVSDGSVNERWSIYSMQIAVALPLCFVLILITIAISWAKYDDLGNEVMSVLLDPPTSTPVYGVTYYWSNIVLMTILLILPIAYLMTENNSGWIMFKYHMKQKEIQEGKDKK